jgi:hypothetical protein
VARAIVDNKTYFLGAARAQLLLHKTEVESHERAELLRLVAKYEGKATPAVPTEDQQLTLL